MYTNADSIINKIDELRYIVKKDLTDVSLVVITEVNRKHIVGKIEESEVKIDGYCLFSINFSLSHFGGIFCYVRNELNASCVSLNTNFNEYLCVKMDNLLVLIVYRSPHSDTVNNQGLLCLLDEFLALRGTKIILGDFNLPNIIWDRMHTTMGNVNFEYLFLQYVLDNYLIQSVDKPTRFRNQQKMNILNLILSPSEYLVSNLTYRAPLGKSDHSVICFDCNLLCPAGRYNTPINKYIFAKGKYSLMNEYLNTRMNVLIDNVNYYYINGLWDAFVCNVRTGSDIFIPRYGCRNNQNLIVKSKKPRNIKLTSDVYVLIKEKNKLWSKYMKTKEIDLLNRFKRIRNITKAKIREQKESFF